MNNMALPGDLLKFAGDREILTYSQLTSFRNCRKKSYWRYKEGLEPVAVDRALRFGSIIHEALEEWDKSHSPFRVLEVLNRLVDGSDREDWLKAESLLNAYLGYWKEAEERWEVVALEKVFWGEIRNPETGRSSRTFVLSGKGDKLVRTDGGLYLVERKTTSKIDGGYIEKLWTDFQIHLYGKYLSEFLGEQIVGAIYDIMQKPGIIQGKGETDQEFHERRRKLIEKSKTGKTTAKQKVRESDADFRKRLGEVCKKDGIFHREVILFTKEKLERLEWEIWELANNYRDATRRNSWYQNPSYCFHWNKPCSYWGLCVSGGSDVLKDTQYQKSPAHRELLEPRIEEPIF